MVCCAPMGHFEEPMSQVLAMVIPSAFEASSYSPALRNVPTEMGMNPGEKITSENDDT